MTLTCPKCRYIRKPTDTAPDYECPNCGVIYAKFGPEQQLKHQLDQEQKTGDWSDVPKEHVPIQVAIDSIILSTTHEAPGRVVETSLGLVGSECAFGMNVFKDFFASVTDVVGGRSGATQGVLRDARNTVLNEMRTQAHALGAHAVVGINITFNEFSGAGKSMLFVAATGTAVRLQP